MRGSEKTQKDVEEFTNQNGDPLNKEHSAWKTMQGGGQGGEEQSRGKGCKGTWEPSGQTEAKGSLQVFFQCLQHQC